MRCAYLPGEGSRCDSESVVVHPNDGPFCDKHMFVCISAKNVNDGTLVTLSKILFAIGTRKTIALSYLRDMADRYAEFIEDELDKDIAGRDRKDRYYSDVADII